VAAVVAKAVEAVAAVGAVLEIGWVLCFIMGDVASSMLLVLLLLLLLLLYQWAFIHRIQTRINHGMPLRLERLVRHTKAATYNLQQSIITGTVPSAVMLSAM
jgi:fumarate reductase subunit D